MTSFDESIRTQVKAAISKLEQIPLKQAGITLTAQQSAAGHHFIGLALGTRYRYFDLSLVNSKAQYPKFYREGLSHYLAADFNNQANSFIDENKLNEAEKLLGQAEGLAPEYFGTYANLTDIHYKRENYDKAFAAAQRAVELEANFAAGHYNLFVVLSQLNREAEAVKSLRKAIALAPEAAEFRVALGESLESSQKAEEAIAEYRQALALNPKLADALFRLGLALFEASKTTEAAARLREGIA